MRLQLQLFATRKWLIVSTLLLKNLPYKHGVGGSNPSAPTTQKVLDNHTFSTAQQSNALGVFWANSLCNSAPLCTILHYSIEGSCKRVASKIANLQAKPGN